MHYQTRQKSFANMENAMEVILDRKSRVAPQRQLAVNTSKFQAIPAAKPTQIRVPTNNNVYVIESVRVINKTKFIHFFMLLSLRFVFFF